MSKTLLLRLFHRILQGALGVGLAALGLAGCAKHEPEPEPIRAVKVITAGESTPVTVAEYAGEVRARVESRLGFRVAGKVIRRQAEVGQRVRAGEVLAQLDPADYALATQAARAQVRSAQTNLDLTAADFKRYKDLRQQDFISGAELERREAALKAAQAQLDQAQAQLAAQSHQEAYTALVADVSGVVTAVEVEAGQVVAAGVPVVRVAQDGARDVVFAVPEDKVAGVKVGAAMGVRAWTDDRVVQGRVREVAASADPVTRTFAVKLAVPAEQSPPLGSTVYVVPSGAGTKAASSSAAIRLPLSALRKDGADSAVWVLDEASMTVRSQAVKVDRVDANEAVVSEGLQIGQRVVVSGVHVLTPGQKVTLYQPARAATK